MPGSRSSSKATRQSTTSATASSRSASVTSKRLPSRPLRTPEEDHAPLRPGADDDSTDDEQETLTPASMPPKQLFVVGSNTDPTVGDEVTVSALVAKRIFPHVKCLCNPVIELAFTNNAKSICGLVRSYCNPPANIPETEWWEHARKWVGPQITIQRSSKNTKLKWSFMGTYTV